MIISIMQISDLHRDPSHLLTNATLLDSLARDQQRFSHENPVIKVPDLVIVSGDLVTGVQPTTHNAAVKLADQYKEAEKFLSALADLFVNSDRERIVIAPGNHDVSFPEVHASLKEIKFPQDDPSKEDIIVRYVSGLYAPGSKLRWSWRSLCFLELTDTEHYRLRMQPFADFYREFYRGARTYSLDPEKQYDVFGYPELGITIAAFNSCFNNDPLNRVASIHPDCIAGASQNLRSDRYRRLRLAAWHHSASGTPTQIDYLDPDTLQVLIDCGFSVGLHGHQHRPRFIDEYYQFGMNRKITVISAGTLCGGRDSLPSGQQRAYNIIQLNTEKLKGMIHLRQMQNNNLSSPIWGPGPFPSSRKSYIDFHVQPPTEFDEDRITFILVEAEALLRENPKEAVKLAQPFVKTNALARRIVVEGLAVIGDSKSIIECFYPPTGAAEIIYVADALWEQGERERLKDLINSPIVRDATDPSITEVRRKYSRRIKL